MSMQSTAGHFDMSQPDHLDRKAVANAARYMGKVAWPTVVLGLLFLIIYVTTVTLALTGLMSLMFAVPVVTLVTYLSYTVLHESVHGSIGGNGSLRWLNKAMGYLAAWITMIPFTAHRFEHMAHHRYANDEQRDPDFHMGNMGESVLAPFREALRAWSGQLSFYARHRWADAPVRQNLSLCLELSVAILPRLAVAAAGFWVEALALFVLAWILGAIILIYLFAYVVHRPHEQVGRYVDTSTILPPRSVLLRGALNWFWMFQNYHSIHHLFPRVPFYKYPALYEEIEDVMAAKGAPVYSLSAHGLEPEAPRFAG